MFIIYLILGIAILYMANRDRKPYKLIFIPLLVLSYFGTLEIYSKMSSTIQTAIFLISIGLGVLLLYFYYRDLKETKRSFLSSRRYQRENFSKVRENQPERTKHITIKNMKTGEEKTYLVRPPKEKIQKKRSK